VSVTLDCTTEEGWKTVCQMRHQAKLLGHTFVVHTGPAPEKTITEKQFKALHVWCREVADYLNECGMDMKKVLKPEVSIDWTTWSVKEYLYKPILKAMSGKESTKDQDTVEPSKVADTIARHLADKELVLPLWPDKTRARL